MPDQHCNRTLNEGLVIVYRSLPMYLGHAAPWVAYGDERAQQVLDRIVADQKAFVHRLSALLDERRHTTDLGEFPMNFTDLHDLSLTFLVKRLISYQKRDIEALESCARRLADDAEGQSLVEEIIDAARGHLESLESLDGHPATTR
jgi:hypothetical protein